MNRKKYQIVFIIAIFIFAIALPTSAVAAESKEINIDLEKLQLQQTVNYQKIIIDSLTEQLEEAEKEIQELKTKVVEEPIEIEQEPITANYSDSIKVKVTEEQKNKVSAEVKKLDNEIKMLAKLIYREARGIKSTDQKAAVVWCVLNRVDDGGYGKTISKVITAKHQFAWVPNTPVKDEFYNLAKDVVTRWLLEKEGLDNVGRVLPKDYLYFAGRDGKNHFRKTYKSRSYWNWSLKSPY